MHQTPSQDLSYMLFSLPYSNSYGKYTSLYGYIVYMYLLYSGYKPVTYNRYDGRAVYC